MENKIEKAADFFQHTNINYILNEPMSRHTTFHIGGNASCFAIMQNEDELSKALKFCYENKIKVFTIGKGSNLLVDDNGVDAVVIKLAGEFEQISLNCNNELIIGAGVNLNSACKFAQENGLSGLEFAFGIPGTVGGALYMNAGAYGGEMKDIVVEAKHIYKNGQTGSFNLHQLNLGYRTSVYAQCDAVITHVKVKLTKKDKYSISDHMNELLEKRKAKQPLEFPSAGSVFKRPDGYFAGALIEQCGLKGESVGGAMVSEKHAGFIVNTGNATCSDVKRLIEICRKRVKEKFGVNLETEIKFI